MNMPQNRSGKQYILVKTDSRDYHQEANDNNNIAFYEINVSSSSARQSNNSFTSKKKLDVSTPKLIETQIVNLFNPTISIKKLVDKSSFDIKSLNLPSGFYAIRFADGESKKVYLK